MFLKFFLDITLFLSEASNFFCNPKHLCFKKPYRLMKLTVFGHNFVCYMS